MEIMTGINGYSLPYTVGTAAPNSTTRMLPFRGGDNDVVNLFSINGQPVPNGGFVGTIPADGKWHGMDCIAIGGSIVPYVTADQQQLTRLKEQALQVCYAIEKIPGSKEATDASVLASALHTALDKILNPTRYT
jgi:hypothetical protein